MQVIRNNAVASSIQTSYSSKQTQQNMSNSHSSHNVSKMRNMNNKEEMQSNCNMKGMHDQANDVAASNSKTTDNKLGAKIDVKA